MKKTKYQVIKAIIHIARRLGVALNKTDKRVSYIIQSHEFFIWKNEAEFNSFIETCIIRIKEEPLELFLKNEAEELS